MTSRRLFLQASTLGAVALLGQAEDARAPLAEFGYGDVTLHPGLAQSQFEQTQAILLGLNEDSLLKPWRLRAGLPAPGPDLGGWYDETPLHKTESGGHGFAPAHSFGQWISALARGYAVNRDNGTSARLERLLALYEPAISGNFYKNFRFPAYNYDKMVIGLLDAHRLAGIPSALNLLERTTNAAEPHLPPTALDRDEPQRRWRAAVGDSTADDYTWDESYTLAENLYLAYAQGCGDRYKTLARRFLLDKTYFDPLAADKNVLGGHHAYSFCNALSSAMQAYMVDGSAKHLRAASNAFRMIAETQSFATGGWGPDESFSAPGSSALYASLSGTHRGFETPCGSYAHFKLTRYLLRVTSDGRYGDSMERVLYNTVLGATPLRADGQAFYYSDYHSTATKGYFPDAWPCCSGTLPQVAADYRILAYFHNGTGLFVNLYLPSTVRWTNPEGAAIVLTQDSEYPIGNTIRLHIRASRPSTFSIRLRIPAWSSRTIVHVNGQESEVHLSKGFAHLERRWKDDDRIELELMMPLRLEAIDSEHTDTVALVRGPLVLFSLGSSLPKVSKEQLLAAAQAERDTWHVATSSGSVTLKPFFALRDEPYSTYLRVS